MKMLSDHTKKKKRDLYKVIEAIEQYDFYFRDICFKALHADESKEKNAKMKSIINLKF